MATTFDFLVSCPKSSQALADRTLLEAHAIVARLELELTEFKPESPVHRLNHSRAGERVVFTAAGIELLERSEKIRVQSRGAFNCLAKSEGAGEIAWDPQSREVWRLSERTHLGFGAIGKGYALDQVRLALERAGFRDYVLSGGGSSLILSGFAGPGDPWTWGWSWRRGDSGENLGIRFAHPTGDPIAIGISGTHEKGRHILDPASGDGVQPVRSALVAHPSAAEADALSTALFVAGWDRGNEFLAESWVSPAVAAVDDEEVPRWNGIFHRLWGSASHDAGDSRAASAALGLLAGLGFLIGIGGLGALPARADDAIDLGAGSADVFAPYMLERSYWWLALPAFTLAVILIHLKKTRKTKLKVLAPSPPLTSLRKSG